MKIKFLKNYGLVVGGCTMLKTPNDPPVEISEEKGNELVVRGIAVAVVAAAATAQSSSGSTGDGGNPPGPNSKDPIVKTPDKMTVDELKAYARDKEIDITGLTKKKDILAAIQLAEESSSTGDGGNPPAPAITAHVPNEELTSTEE